MGRAKEEMLEYEELGFAKPKDINICSNHFSDDAIINYIELNSSEISCSYCKPKYQSHAVITFDEFMRFLCRGIYFFYDDAANAGLPYDSSEGGYQGVHFDTYDLIYNEICLDSDKDEIVKDILNLLPDQFWCKKSPFSLDENQELIYDWKNFSDLLKHKIRYSFFRTTKFKNDRYTEVCDILREIALSIEKLNLIKTIKKNQSIYRCRQHTRKELPKTIRELGSPPIKNCSFSNRMSPAGISMFYGAFDKKTAIKEATDVQKVIEKPLITTGLFILKQDLQIIDLCNLPDIPSIFDDERRSLRSKTLFLKEFVNEISKNIKRDGHEHIDYVPTQVVTEYFRYVVPEIAHYSIDGIIYPSAKEGGENCCVLFFDNNDCENIFDLPISNISIEELK